MGRDVTALLTDREVKLLEESYARIMADAIGENPDIVKMVEINMVNFLRPLLTQQMANDLCVEEYDIESLFNILITKDPEKGIVILSLTRKLH